MVGTGGLEPPTPTVSKKNIKINEMGFLPSLIDLLTLLGHYRYYDIFHIFYTLGYFV